METLRSILVVRAGDDSPCTLNKAMALAKVFGATVQELEASSFATELSLNEQIAEQVDRTAPDLVIKRASGRHPLERFSLDQNDWRLARECPSIVMLTRDRQWSDAPKFAAAVDVSKEERRKLARSIMRTSEYLALGCRAELEVIYVDPGVGSELQKRKRTTVFTRLAGEHRVDARHMHLLDGEVDRCLPSFVAAQNYDVLVLGALTQRRGAAALIGTLTSRLADAVDCDLVLVKPRRQ